MRKQSQQQLFFATCAAHTLPPVSQLLVSPLVTALILFLLCSTGGTSAVSLLLQHSTATASASSPLHHSNNSTITVIPTAANFTRSRRASASYLPAIGGSPYDGEADSESTAYLHSKHLQSRANFGGGVPVDCDSPTTKKVCRKVCADLSLNAKYDQVDAFSGQNLFRQHLTGCQLFSAFTARSEPALLLDLQLKGVVFKSLFSVQLKTVSTWYTLMSMKGSQFWPFNCYSPGTKPPLSHQSAMPVEPRLYRPRHEVSSTSAAEATAAEAEAAEAQMPQLLPSGMPYFTATVLDDGDLLYISPDFDRHFQVIGSGVPSVAPLTSLKKTATCSVWKLVSGTQYQFLNVVKDEPISRNGCGLGSNSPASPQQPSSFSVILESGVFLATTLIVLAFLFLTPLLYVISIKW